MSQPPVELAIKNENGQVIIVLNRLVNHIEMGPDNAIAIAGAITDNAFEAKNMVKPLGDTLKAELVERHREKLLARVALMLGSMNQPSMTNGQRANKILDVVFSEVFS